MGRAQVFRTPRGDRTRSRPPGRSRGAGLSGGPAQSPRKYAVEVNGSPGPALEHLEVLGRRARAAARLMARSSATARNEALIGAAGLIEDDADRILAANEDDVARSRAEGAGTTSVDRLRLDRNRVRGMAEGLRQVAGLADPVGEIVDGWVRPNGLRIRQVRTPLGVIGIIYENRPNVTSDAAGLCLKSGNAVLLRGSSSAIGTNRVIAGALRAGLDKAGLPVDAVSLVEDTSHRAAVDFMRLEGSIDCLIPRGGPALVAAVREHATVPYILDGAGNCHIYVDSAADLSMASAVVRNAKTQRPGVCNAAETLLVHRLVADAFVPALASVLSGVELVGDDATRALLASAGTATDEDYATEFLDLRMAIAVVDDIDGAIDHIARFGSGHSEAIVTRDLAAATRFTQEVDAAVVLVNASTRFVDGEEFGLGAEIGISTQKLHARGPMGLRALTCVKFVVHGEGQTRS
ncbi:MAG: glutamate-5-semialdehyde dehydrogenase [Acidimicrobiales bacterium]